MMNLDKIHIVSKRETLDVVGVKRDLRFDSHYKIDIFEAECDGVEYYITNIPLYTTTDGDVLMVADLDEIAQFGEYKEINEYKQVLDVNDILADIIKKKGNNGGLILNYATLVNKVAIVAPGGSDNV